MRIAYKATLYMELELIAPFTIGGQVLCCANAPSGPPAYHFKNNSVASMVKPVSMANAGGKEFAFSTAGDMIVGFCSNAVVWSVSEDGGVWPNSAYNDCWDLCAGTYVKIEQWVED